MNTAAVKETLIDAAEQAHARFPQYANHWRSPDWKLARVKRGVKTKAGRSFSKDEIVLARVSPHDGPDFVDAYSAATKVDTLLGAKDVEFLEGA